MSEELKLFLLVFGIVVLCLLMLAAAGGFVYLYFWALCKLLVAVITAICSGAVSVLHAIRT